MRKKIAGLMILVSVASLLITSIDARGGGRGGGGRSGGGEARGGAYHGGNVMNRTPTMSRASNRPAAARPNAAGRNRTDVRQGPSAANRQDIRNQVNRYEQNRPAAKIDRQDLSARTQNFSSNRKNQITQNRQISDRASERMRRSWPDSNQWFDRNFFDRHNIDVGYLGNGANLWRPAAWGTLATWGAWNFSTPYYYDNGDYNYPVTPTEYASYTYQSTPQAGSDWLPLGVFAVTSNAAQASQSNRFIQLAINRNGEIDGVFYNSATDTAQDLAGMVDQKTQRAYWSMANRPGSPIASTGIYNLTEDKTSINVHFPDGTDQNWTLVRLQQ